MSYYCGWDGGGSKTEVLCADAAGREIARRSFGPLNINGTSRERAAQTIADAAAFMRSMPGGLEACRGLVIGAAGVSNAQMKEFISARVRGEGFGGSLSIVGDHEIALAGAVHGPGAVLIAGTGSVCRARDENGNSARAGGFGHLIDDGGSGYAIGRDILKAVVRAQDGRGPQSCLSELVFRQLGVESTSGILTWLYSPQTGKTEVAALAPLLLTALEEGDEAAEEIALAAAHELAGLALAVWRRLKLDRGELALTGSVLNHYPRIRELVGQLCRAQYPQMQVIAPHGGAPEGAVRLAMERFPGAEDM